MRYVTPFSVIKKTYLDPNPESGQGDGGSIAMMSEETIMGVVKLLLRGADVDEDWYRTTYPDVAEAINKGVFRSAKQHFIDSGYVEGRLPGEMPVDEKWYLAAYPDVADGVEDGLFSSCAEHFRLYGYSEGRIPFEI